MHFSNDDVKTIDIEEFVDKGFLQEVNRQFFHPLGLALEVQYNEGDDTFQLGRIWDYRDDPEGILFETIDIQKIKEVNRLRKSKEETRIKKIGSVIQEKGL